jgi:hypothetical protein
VQDGGPLHSSFTTQMQCKSPALIISCSAGGGERPPDLNNSTCRYYLDTESALCDATMNSSLVTRADMALFFLGKVNDGLLGPLPGLLSPFVGPFGKFAAVADRAVSEFVAVRYTFFQACPTRSRNRSYLTICVFVQFYLQCSNHRPHHLDSVWYFF